MIWSQAFNWGSYFHPTKVKLMSESLFDLTIYNIRASNLNHEKRKNPSVQIVPLSILTKGKVKYCPLTLILCFMNAQIILFL